MRISKVGVLFCAFITLLNDRLSETIILPLIPKLNTNFGISTVILGLLIGTYPFAQFTFAPLIGAISDKYGRKPIIIVCVAGSVIGLGLFAFSIHLWNANLPIWQGGTPLILGLLFGARIIDGASGGTASTAAAILADISTPENRAKTFGIIGAAFGLGFIIGPLIGGLLTNISFSLPALIGTLFAIFNLLIVIYILPETYKNKDHKPSLKKRELNPIYQLIKVFNNPLINRLSLAFFLFFMAFNGLTAFLLLYQEKVCLWVGKTPVLEIFGFVITKGLLPSLSLAWVGVIAIVVQGGLIGKLVKHFGESRLTMSGIGFVIAGCLLLVSATPENSIPIVFTACFFLAIGTGLVVPSLRAIISKKLTSSGQGAVLGNLQGLQSLGSFLGALIAGAAYKNIGPSSPFWLGMFLLTGVGLLINGGLKNIRGKTAIKSV